MKKFRIESEVPAIVLVLLPFLYLAWIWNSLPEQVPLHWNIVGEADRYGSRKELILVPLLLPFLVYILMWFIPFVDSKNAIIKKDDKYDLIKLILVGVTSVLAILILNVSRNETILNINYLILGIGILYMILGNFFKTIRSNYFIGIRTPWTLADELVWRKTHKLAGIIWLVGGLIIILLSFFLDHTPLSFGMIIVTAVIVLIPVIYSYIAFQHFKNQD